MRTPTRRRLLQVSAGLASLGVGPAVPGRLRYRWTGSALGAAASLDLYHDDRAEAARLVARMVAEVDRLEAIFSLQRTTSALARLNRDGRLVQPPVELVAVLETAASFSAVSDGAFDVTVQPLWRLLAAAGAQGSVPDGRAVAGALARVGWRRLDVGRRSIGFARPGMAATLNGIAQGYITDRIAGLLRDAGLEDALVELGETRAMGRPPESAWRVVTPVGPVALAERALAVSSARPADCGLAGSSPNLISARTGLPVLDGRTVVVGAPSAMLADAASTALAASERAAMGHLAARLAPLGITVFSAPHLGDA
ncbi:MAG: FAD:protein FMN transferase [Geminicoccaceae bacterium]